MHLGLTLVGIIYGANFVIAKEAMPEYIKPMGFILLRASFAIIIFTLVHSLFVKEKILQRDIPRIILCGMFGVSINQLCFFKGLAITSPINASLLMITTPVLVLILSVIILKEALNGLKVIGIICGALGAFLLIYFSQFMPQRNSSLVGDLFVFINATSYALYLIIVKPLMKKYHPLTILKWVFIFGWFPIVFFGFPELKEVVWNFPTNVVLAILYVLIFATVAVYLINIFALSMASPTIVSVYIYLQPVVSTIVAISMGKDNLDWIKIISAILIFAAVFLVSYRRNLVKV